MNTLDFSGEGIAFLSHFQATNDIRYYLEGICLRPLEGGGVLGAATNGHMLGLWFDGKATIDKERILKVSKPLIAALKKKPDNRLKCQDGRLACMFPFTNSAGELIYFEEKYIQPLEKVTHSAPSWAIDGNFPKTDIFIEQARRAMACNVMPFQYLSGDYLETILKSRGARKSSRFAAVVQIKALDTDTENDQHGKAFITFQHMPEALAILMPVVKPVSEKGRLTGLPLPWLDSIASTAKK